MGKSVIRAAAAALVLSVAFNSAHAAGLGRLTVLSSLGQPFRGEVDLVAVKKDELGSLTARIASPDAFRQADLPFTAYISNLKLSIEKRPNGDPYVKVTAAQPLNEPFIDFLVEVSWTSGRLVRAYTALLDPPAVTETAAEAPPVVAAAQVEPPAAQPVPKIEPPAEPRPKSVPAPVEATRAAEPNPEPAPRAEPGPEAEAPAVAAPEASTALTGSSAVPVEHKVRRGDTLGKIARANKPADVTLEQMLVLLYRNNPDAFVGKNMNRLRTGRVLRMPDTSEAAALTPAEARTEVRVQAANWNAYREKLSAFAAATPVAEDAGAQSAAGKITSKVEDKAPSLTEAPKEVLKLSKGEPAKDAKALERVRTLEEEVAAKGKAASDANARVAQLEKQIKDMQALVELKSKSMADLQKPAAPAKPVEAAPPSPAPVAAVKPEPVVPPKPTKPGEAPSLLPPTADSAAPKPDAAPAPDLALPSSPPATADATTPPVGTPIEPPKPVVKRKPFVPPPPPPPPSLMDQILGEPLYLAGGAAIIAALGGLGFLGWKRRRASAAAAPHEEPTLPPVEDFVPAAAATIPGGTPIEIQEDAEHAAGSPDGSDPLAEADVFLIYGRDVQAEERLKEAIAAQPMRYELHAKLLEIYAKRGDAMAFEAVAKDIQIGTGAQGEYWDKAVRLGYELDPGNPRYAAGRPEGEPTERTFPGSDQTLQMPAYGEDGKTDLDFNLGFDEGPQSSSTDIDLGELGQSLSRESASGTTTDIDLSDLGGGSDFGEVLDPTKTIGGSPAGAERVSTMQMEAFDPTATLAVPETGDLPTLPGVSSGAAAADDIGLDFDLGDAEPGNAPAMSTADSSALDDISFDLNTLQLDTPPLETAAAAAQPQSGPPDLDLSGISLDLGDSSAAPAGKDEKWYDVQTKFDLAKAYQEMGDAEGAREILQEVLAEGDAEQKSAAESLLTSLG